MSNNINNIINNNTNINDNRNSMGINDGDVSAFYITSIRTWNGLYLINDDGRVVQNNSGPLDQRRYWQIHSGSIINNITGRYMGLRGPVDQNGIPVVTISGSDATTQWRLDRVGPDQYMIENSLSGKVLDVPENSSEPGVQIIQYRRKVPLFENPQNQIFIFEIF